MLLGNEITPAVDEDNWMQWHQALAKSGVSGNFTSNGAEQGIK